MRYRTPGALAIAALLVMVAASTALAQDASVVYLEGEPELRTAGGASEWLDFGVTLTPGDSVVTGRSDFVELEQGAAATIRINPETVFTIREVERNGQREQVMSNSVGSVGYRFNRLAGRNEPRIGTSTVVAGIRGTEVMVYAGANGSSLFLVESGEVAVTSAGETVSLVENEGVEVPAGGPPGEKFSRIGREIDFSSWNQEKTQEYLDDPVASVVSLITQLDLFIEGFDEYTALYQEFAAEYESELERMLAMEDGEEKETLRAELLDFGKQTRVQALNYRYYALSALSMRRFVLGRMYTEMKTRYILQPSAREFVEFKEQYQAFLSMYESNITAGLVEADI